MESLLEQKQGEMAHAVQIYYIMQKCSRIFPLEIAYKDRLIIDGEVIIKYDDFERINNTLPKEKSL